MGQSFSRHESPPSHTDNLYRSRSTRSFADITVSAFRRSVRRIRECLANRSRPKVENIELNLTGASLQQVTKELCNIVKYEKNDLTRYLSVLTLIFRKPSHSQK